MRMRDAINDPGKGSGTGDDRYGFDEAAKIAWVVDGATDVGRVRLFPQLESDAAWLAEVLSTRFLTPPPEGQSLEAYFADVVKDLGERARSEAQFELANTPRDSWPTAAFVWTRKRNDVLDIVSFGDCAVLIQDEVGVRAFADVGKHDSEAERAQAFANTTWEEKLPYLQREREAYNTPGVFVDPLGGEPVLPSRIKVETIPIADGGRVLLMSDGLYRLVTPFGDVSDEGLMRLVEQNGLADAVTRLRHLERDPSGPARFKTSDDATGLLITV